MPFFFDNFCPLLGFGGRNPPSPLRGAATGHMQLSTSRKHNLNISKSNITLCYVLLLFQLLFASCIFVIVCMYVCMDVTICHKLKHLIKKLNIYRTIYIAILINIH